jgi:transposase
MLAGAISYFLGGRDLPSFKDFIYSDLSGTVVVHDRYQNYDAIPGISHQLCCAHLLRDLVDAAQSYPDAIWPGQAADALRALIHAANQARDRGLASVPDDAIAEDLRLFRHGVRVGLAQLRGTPGGKTPSALPLLECLRDREADVLRFLTGTAIPPTSNQAERDLRPAKTQQKISGRLCSEKTTRDRYAIRGYCSTAAKHGHSVFTAIRDALAGNPWTPPEAPAVLSQNDCSVSRHFKGRRPGKQGLAGRRVPILLLSAILLSACTPGSGDRPGSSHSTVVSNRRHRRWLASCRRG